MDSFSECLPVLRSLLATAQANLPTLAITLILVAASIKDFASHRIPNALTVTGALLGLALQYLARGWAGFGDGLAGFATGFFIFLPLYAFGWMGAGDVKLMGAAGTFVGWPGSLLAVSLSAGIGAAIALLLITTRGGLLEYLLRYGLMARCLLTAGRCAYIPPNPGSAAARSFPYAFAIALGTLAALWWLGRFDPWLGAMGG